MSLKSIVTSLVILGTSSVALARPVYTGSQWSPPPPPVVRDHRGDNGFAVNGGFSADFNAGFDSSIGFSTDDRRPDFRDSRFQNRRWNNRRYRHIDSGYDTSYTNPYDTSGYDTSYTNPYDASGYDTSYTNPYNGSVGQHWVTIGTVNRPFNSEHQPLVFSLGQGMPVQQIRLRSLGAYTKVYDVSYHEANGRNYTYSWNHVFGPGRPGWTGQTGTDLDMGNLGGRVITSIEMTGVNAPNTTFIVQVLI